MRSREYHRTCLLLASAAWTLLTALVATTVSAQELRYTSNPQQEFAYKVDITAERNDATEFLKGVVTFTVKGSSSETVRIGYYGGLTKTRKAKPGTSSAGPSRGRGGPSRFGGPRGFGGPPRRGGPNIFLNPFAGLTRVNNELVIGRRGEVQTLKGTSQLPYLLGNLSVMFFEPLPNAGQQQWTVRNGVSITEGGRSSRPPFFRPSPSSTQEKSSAASESTVFSIKSSDDRFVVVSKTYRLNMPAGDDSDASFGISGTGTWTFNRDLQVPESLDFKQKLTVKDGNTSVTVPVSIRYTRLSAEELATYRKKREAMVAEAKQKLADRKKAANSALSAENKQKILANLNSDNKQVITNQMVRLKIMKPHPDDKDVALLIQKHIQDGHRPLRMMAQAAWGRWKVLVEEPATESPALAGSPFEVPDDTKKLRTWQDATGKFSIEAEFISLSAAGVKLKRKDGKEVTVPFDRLSKADQTAARKLAM